MLERPVKDIMTQEVVSCQPSDDVESAIHKMNNLGVRHLPVVEDGRVVDVIAHRRALEVLCKGGRARFRPASQLRLQVGRAVLKFEKAGRALLATSVKGLQNNNLPRRLGRMHLQRGHVIVDP